MTYCRQMRSLLMLVCVAGLLVSSAQAVADVTLTAGGPIENTEDGTFTVDLFLANSEPVRGFQFRLVSSSGTRVPTTGMVKGVGAAGENNFQASTAPATGTIVGFSMIGATIPISTRSRLFMTVTISNEFKTMMGSDKVCISTEFPPVFAGVDGQSALSVEMPKCADEEKGEMLEEQLLDQAIEDPESVPIRLSLGEMKVDDLLPHRVILPVFIHNTRPVSGFQFAVLRVTGPDEEIPGKTRAGGKTTISVLGAKDGIAGEHEFQVSGGASGTVVGVHFSGESLPKMDDDEPPALLTTLLLDRNTVAPDLKNKAGKEAYDARESINAPLKGVTVCLDKAIIAGEIATSLPVALPPCGRTRSEQEANEMKQTEKMIAMLKQDKKKEEQDYATAALDYAEKAAKRAGDYKSGDYDYSAEDEALKLSEGHVKLKLGPVTQQGLTKQVVVKMHADVPIRGFQFRIVDQYGNHAPVTAAAGGKAAQFTVTTSPITGAVIGFSMVGANISPTEPGVEMEVLTTLALASEFPTDFACFNSEERPVFANSPQSGPIAVEVPPCPKPSVPLTKAQEVALAAEENVQNVELDKDGSVVDVEEANVALFLNNPVSYEKKGDTVVIGVTVYIQSQVAIRGFQFELADTEGNPFPMAHKRGGKSDLLDSITVGTQGRVLGFSMQGTEIPPVPNSAELISFQFSKTSAQIKEMMANGKLKGIPGGICIVKPVFASEKENVPVLLPDCSPLVKNDADFEFPQDLKPKDVMVERKSARGEGGMNVASHTVKAVHDKAESLNANKKTLSQAIKEGRNATTQALKAKTALDKTAGVAQQMDNLLKRGKAAEVDKILEDRARAHKNREKLVQDRNLADARGQVTHEDLKKHYDEIQELKKLTQQQNMELKAQAKKLSESARLEGAKAAQELIDRHIAKNPPSKGSALVPFIVVILVLVVVGLIMLNFAASRKPYSRGILGNRKVYDKM